MLSLKHTKLAILSFSCCIGSACAAIDSMPLAQTPADIKGSINAALPPMVEIPGGSFTMGDQVEEGDANEQPVHEVSIRAFKFAKYETTYDLFDIYTRSLGQELKADGGYGRSGYPVMQVSWRETNEFIDWLNEQTGRKFRLPSESEWEYAARAGTDTIFSWGNEVNRDNANYGKANCCSNGSGQGGRDIWDEAAPIGSFLPNPFGLYDMAGNLQEWSADCWNESYAGAPSDGSPWLTGNCERAPLRGGSWNHHSRNLRPANRNSNVRNSSAGFGYTFRLAEDL